jgi:2-polyprenyl-3-methyl-5-hydroxy-6-metoxy-1,4-benzoquinol methylase
MKKLQLHPQTAGNEQLYREALYEMVRDKKGVLIDLGSGNGEDTRVLANEGRFSQTFCVDYDAGLVKQAASLGFLGVVADFNLCLPFKSAFADVVVCNQVIEHIARTDLLMQEIYRILKPGGMAIVCTPNLAAWHNIYALVRGWQPFSMQISDDVYLGNPKHPHYQKKISEHQAHLRVFTRLSLEELALHHGFGCVKVSSVGFYPFIHSRLSRRLAQLDPHHAAYLLAELIK